MHKIVRFDRPTCRAAGAEVAELLAAFAEEHGLVVEYRGRHDELRHRLHDEVGPGAQGCGRAARCRARAQDFKLMATAFGLKADDLGRQFQSRGWVYTITGLKPGAPKFPIIADRIDGKSFKFPASVVKNALAVA